MSALQHTDGVYLVRYKLENRPVLLVDGQLYGFDGDKINDGLTLGMVKVIKRVLPPETGQGIATLLPDHEANQKKETR